jgi:hypothetical protein
MTRIDDLPAPAVRLITRFARTRRIPGTNRYARVCRSWQEAAADREDQEQLQLLLPLEGLRADALTSTSAWLGKHGQCVTSLYITYYSATAALFKQLPLSTAPLVGLARLEVDGPDSLVALAPALPQLVALTHLRASIGLVPVNATHEGHVFPEGVFSTHGVSLEAPPSLQQLCPGLKSLRLDITSQDVVYHSMWVKAPVAQLLPDHLEQLHINGGPFADDVSIPCAAALTSFTSLRCVTLAWVCGLDVDLLLSMPGLEEVDLLRAAVRVDGHDAEKFAQWVNRGGCTTPQHLTKLTHLFTTYPQPGPASAAPQLAALPGLRKLHLNICEPGAAAYVQQLSSLSRLQHLSVAFLGGAERDVADALSALSSVSQLTYLSVRTRSAQVPRPTWAAVLPHLTQLRVLGTTLEQLRDEGLAEELYRLRQLQCVYVAINAPYMRVPVVAREEVAPQLQVLGKCGSLRAVLCWGDADDDDDNYDDVWGVWEEPPEAHPLHQHVQEGQVHLSSWHNWAHAAREGRVLCPRPCPHLPGVWELQQVEPGTGLGRE